MVCLYSEKTGYIESSAFSSKKKRTAWAKRELKELTNNEKIYAMNEKRKPDSFFALYYDYSGIITP